MTLTDDIGRHVNAIASGAAGEAGEPGARGLDPGLRHRPGLRLPAGILRAHRGPLEGPGCAGDVRAQQRVPADRLRKVLPRPGAHHQASGLHAHRTGYTALPCPDQRHLRNALPS